MKDRFVILALALFTAGLAACDSTDAESGSRLAADTTADAAAVRAPEPASTSPAADSSSAPAAAEQSVDDAPVAGDPAEAPSTGTMGTDGRSSSAPPAREAAAPAAPASGGQAANDILRRAEEAYAGVRSMEADFVQQVYVPLLESTLDSHGKMYHRAPDRFLMKFEDPAGDVIVADGQYAWMYYPSNDARQVMRARLAEGGQQVDLQREFLRDATERYTATRTGSETVGGRQTHVLTLHPRGPSPYSEVQLWVDTQNHLVRRFRITEPNESVRTIELSGIRPNVTLADSLFRFTPPPGAQVIEP